MYVSRQLQPLDWYLQEINRIPLLTPDEEVELARRIKQGIGGVRSEFLYYPPSALALTFLSLLFQILINQNLNKPFMQIVTLFSQRLIEASSCALTGRLQPLARGCYPLF